MVEDVRLLYRYRAVIHSLVVTQLRMRYQRSALGVLWTLLNPLLLLSVQAFVFSQVLGINTADYALYLFTGLVFWQFFSAGIESASRSLIANEGLIRRVAAPALVFPVSDVIVAMANAGFSLVALAILFLWAHAPIGSSIVLLVPGILLSAAFTLGGGLITMTLVTFYRDFMHIISVALLAAYFATPILYPEALAGRRAVFLKYNPLSNYVTFFHDALLTARVITHDPSRVGVVWPDAWTWTFGTLSAIVTLGVGYTIFQDQ